ncbi:MAG: transporter substrate-binding domain-containing protein, partial [Sphingobacteriales bacterium]
MNKRQLLLFALLLVWGMPIAFAQQGMATDSWAKVKQQGHGHISVLWCEIEPFIYRNKGSITGVEYELMQGFPAFLKSAYQVDVQINWQKMDRFEDIYPTIKGSKEQGLFGLSYFSITEERKREVRFSPPYMPDLNIIVTSNTLPVYQSADALLKDLAGMQGYTMANTTMKEDMLRLQLHAKRLPLHTMADDYEVMRSISQAERGIGYVPLSIYIVGLQKGIRIKRQKVLAVSREGFAAIYGKASDWEEPIHAYFESPACKALIEQLIRKHLGAEVSAAILEASAPDSLRGLSADIELLTKEREIVTGRLINTALEVARGRIFRNLIIAAVLVAMV